MEGKIKENQLYYFGTSLTSAGHYIWALYDDSMGYSSTNYDEMFRYFNPEKMPYGDNYNRLGATEFYFENGFSIWAICGSCYDKRPGSKTVFFIKKQLQPEEMWQMLEALPIVKKILEALSVKSFKTQNQ